MSWFPISTSSNTHLKGNTVPFGEALKISISSYPSPPRFSHQGTGPAEAISVLPGWQAHRGWGLRSFYSCSSYNENTSRAFETSYFYPEPQSLSPPGKFSHLQKASAKTCTTSHMPLRYSALLAKQNTSSQTQVTRAPQSFSTEVSL